MISYITSRKKTIVPSQSLDSEQQQHACKDVYKFFILPKKSLYQPQNYNNNPQKPNNPQQNDSENILLRVLFRSLCAALPSFCLHIKRPPTIPQNLILHTNYLSFYQDKAAQEEYHQGRDWHIKKNVAQLVHTRHHSVHDFRLNQLAVTGHTASSCPNPQSTSTTKCQSLTVNFSFQATLIPNSSNIRIFSYQDWPLKQITILNNPLNPLVPYTCTLINYKYLISINAISKIFIIFVR